MNEKRIVDERSRDIGKFKVGRLLPVRQKRQVGPFTFIDHMGPETLRKGFYMDVDQHPHIGLATLTYLFEGEIEHRDSLGSIQRITPGDARFMTAGKGITHTERTPLDLRNDQDYPVHGYQIWIALPEGLEEMEPVFEYLPNSEMPEWTENDLKIRLVAGSGFERESKLKVWSPLFMVDVFARSETSLDIRDRIKGELAIVVATGKVTANVDVIHPRRMLNTNTSQLDTLHFEKDTRVLLLGGQPFEKPRYLLWNFVSSRRERLEQAKQDWKQKNFPKVPGDDTYVPIPF